MKQFGRTAVTWTLALALLIGLTAKVRNLPADDGGACKQPLQTIAAHVQETGSEGP